MIRALALAALAVLLMSCEDGRLTFLQNSGEASEDGSTGDAPVQVETTDPVSEAGPDQGSGTDTVSETEAPAPAPTQTQTDARSATQIACEDRGGNFVSAGPSGARLCQTRTRDGNKVCTASSQCEGACLARSATCAPVTPLLGCNDIITDSGGMATVCID